MRKKILFILLFSSMSIIFSQSSQVMDKIIESDTVEFRYGLYLILVASNHISQDIDPLSVQDSDIINQLNSMNIKINPQEINSNLTYFNAAYLVMESLNIKGGVFYTIFKNPRYALRELKYLTYLQKDIDGNDYISGIELINLIGEALHE
ncbi:MAG: hypothetical protein JXR64_06520 [Spirochaetales bacterium]|nr:hypothetical protein [Spirochaetales bacterium]